MGSVIIELNVYFRIWIRIRLCKKEKYCGYKNDDI